MVAATGIGSGLDIEGIVSGLVSAERIPTEARLDRSEASFSSELSALGQFRSALSSVESSLSGLANGTTFRQRTTSSSNEDALTLTAGTLAIPSNYQIGIDQLAQTHSLASGSFASSDEAIGTGTLTIRFGTTDFVPADPGPESYNSFAINPEADTLSIEIDESNNTLEGIRDAINAESGAVSAVIVNDGEGFRLLLNATEEGAENSIQISVEDTGDLDNTDAAGLSAFSFDGNATNLEQTLAAQDAIFRINGLSISSASNSVTNVIEGITLDLSEVTEDDVLVSVERDTSEVTSAINEFIEAYNSFATTIDTLTSFDPETQTAGPLNGDFAVRTIEGQLRSLVTGELANSTGAFSFISEVGITTTATGTLTVDQTALNEALEENPDDFIDLFSALGTPSTVGIEFISDTDETQTGTFDVNISQAAARAELIGTAINFPFNIDTSNNTFVIEVNGNTSGTINLTSGSFATGEDLAAELQSRINGDDALSEENARVIVEFDEAINGLVIRSPEFGSSQSLEILSAGSGFFNSFGLTSGTRSEGLDVEGTIGGSFAEGVGQSLVGGEGSEAEGLSLIIETDQVGNIGQVAFTRGIADQVSTLISQFLDADGIIDAREEGLSASLEDIESQRAALDLRIDAFEQRTRAEFNALDSLLANLNSTGSFLAQQLATLPTPGNNN